MSELAKKDLRDLSKLLRKDLAMDASQINLKKQYSLEKLHDILSEQIERLLDEDPAYLVNLLYRIDVPEIKFKRALEAPGMMAKSEQLASMVIERELKKIETRKRFSHLAE
ncbi:hypothetical protein OO013_08780 [Mangrovivirga sp. M17]|uniref:Uncharacterized protein n=1 Tax=Mangrovivirga halotolerans TaxID=2993936 RepID=A0ABT3RQW5_9BACT|nr:hypothetical protein [Mangrovivirga halotolerans]MCX2743958.1 hypothetical protein [Mangrovivirga halotolerans]